MNCEKLNQDIAKLQTLRDRFARKVDELNDSMRGKIETRKIQKEIQELENQVLESYLTEFKEKNPELFRWHLGEKINGFKGIAWSIAQLPEGEGVLVGGNVGTLYVCRKDKDGKWKLGEKIDGFEDGYGNSIDIASIAQLPDGEGMLVGGSSGKLFVCRKNEEGKWKLEEEISGFKDVWGDACNIETIAPLPDGEGMLVGGNVGTLYVCRKDKDSKWTLGEKINGFEDIYGNSIDITSITQLPDGGMLIGSNRGVLYECRKYEDEKWALLDSIGGFVDTNGEYLDIRSIVPLPDGGILVGGRGGLYECRYEVEYGEWFLNNIVNGFEDEGGYSLDITSIAQLPDGEGVLVGGDAGALYVCRKDKNKKWKLGEKIDGFEDKGGYIPSVTSVAQLPDGEMLINHWGVLYEVNHSSPSVNTIKQNLDIIIQKGAV